MKLIPVEIKSGQTFTTDFLAGLKSWICFNQPILPSFKRTVAAIYYKFSSASRSSDKGHQATSILTTLQRRSERQHAVNR